MVKLNPKAKSLICKNLRSGTFVHGEEFNTDSKCTCVGGVVAQTYLKTNQLDIVIVRDLLTWVGLSDPAMNRFANATEKWNKTLTFEEIADKIESEW